MQTSCCFRDWIIPALIAFTCATASVELHADIVVTLDVAPTGTFDLFLEDDNQGSTTGTFGIASYSVPLLGSVLTLDHKSPNSLATNGSSFGFTGFTQLRSADGNPTVRASQDTVSGTSFLVPDMGRANGNLSTYIPGGFSLFLPEQPTYSRKLLVASGTWNTGGVAPTVDQLSIDFGGNVFANSSLSATHSATFAVAAVPEPSAMLMCFVPVVLCAWRKLLYR